MRTKKCINGEAEWKHPMKKNNRFKSNGKEMVKCPCKHDQCQVEVMESTAYRHMKYGITHRTIPFKISKHGSISFSDSESDSDSDSERDL